MLSTLKTIDTCPNSPGITATNIHAVSGALSACVAGGVLTTSTHPFTAMFSSGVHDRFNTLPKQELQGSQCIYQGEACPLSQLPQYAMPNGVGRLTYPNGDTIIGRWIIDPDTRISILDTNSIVRIDSEVDGYTYVGQVKLSLNCGLYEEGCRFVPNGHGTIKNHKSGKVFSSENWQDGKVDGDNFHAELPIVKRFKQYYKQ